MDQREKGKQAIRELMGLPMAKRMEESADSGTFGSTIAGYAIDQAFGDIWTRPNLDWQQRSLVTMAVMIALRQPNEFGIHMNIALNNGLSLDQIEEVIIQTLPYVGYPAVSSALAVARKVIEERGLDSNPDYKGQRGLL